MADKPIIFSAPMVRALLDGQKTQTRRALATDVQYRDWMTDEAIEVLEAQGWSTFDDADDNAFMAKPHHNWRDRLYVREAWRSAEAYDDLAPSEMGGEEAVKYEADGQIETWGWSRKYDLTGRYRHARFMPRWASRLTLIVTDVRVQRLQEITRDDAISEGLRLASDNIEQFWRWPEPHDARVYLSPIVAFRDLWNSLHGPEAWDANPWVVALTFTVHRCNIDQMDAEHV